LRQFLKKMYVTLRREFWHRIVIAGEVSRGFDYTSEGLLLAQLPAADGRTVETMGVVIAGRSLCYETQRHIPVDSRYEALKIARKIPLDSPFTGIRKIKLIKGEAGGFDAVITLINAERLRQRVKIRPIAVLPVTWLIGGLANGESVQVAVAGEMIGFVPVGRSGVTALLKSGQQQNFWWAAGEDESSIKHIDESGFLSDVPSALGSLGVELWVEALHGNGFVGSRRSPSIDLKRLAIVSAVSSAVYLVVASVVLMLAASLIDSRVSNEPQELSSVLATRAEVNKLVAANTALTDIVGEQYPVWAVLPVMESITSSKALLRSLNYEAGEVEVSLIGVDATQTLDAVISSDYTLDAEFSVPVSRDERLGGDRFSIRWRVVDSETSKIPRPTASAEGGQ